MFEPFPKIARLKRSVIVTEKLDGTNAQVIISPISCSAPLHDCVAYADGLALYAGSRTRLITPGKDTDNFGFAAWVLENAAELVKLGEGRHFGEWYGRGIQRGYGLDERRFALFNTSRWATLMLSDANTAAGLSVGSDNPPACCSVVPVICGGDIASAPDLAMKCLRATGSRAARGFMNPEGIVVYHTASRTMFKQTFDDKHKEAA